MELVVAVATVTAAAEEEEEGEEDFIRRASLRLLAGFIDFIRIHRYSLQ